jgi:hypothetical protein
MGFYNIATILHTLYPQRVRRDISDVGVSGDRDKHPFFTKILRTW